ncbi:LysR substrate-binding domain-containing protein [Sphaerotilus mobilis]|uniref:DNA-binding transcriptional LysR family regulator n=1 Tax=Sphaerotilus mobilis TaxID=47994 RepID=A0A4V2EX41_9BURK|nr:LysR substrate-binding domain-containing protein [Sphaerotilus mobilis]RZS58170.1 DNA-binding transcriptional LysR family regulator [Sphaerotilus mobilis]
MNLLDAMRYLAALEQHRHFGRAAQACHITQPALSNALRSLETSLGVPIVRRGRQFEGLTPEGERVLASARRMLHEQERLTQDLASFIGRPRGRLQIGVVPTALPVAMRLAARLHERCDGIQPVVRSLSSQAIEAGLENLTLDLALGYTDRQEVAQRRLTVWPQYTERYYLVERDRAERPGDAGPLEATGATCRWSDAAARALVLLTPEMHNRAIVDRALQSAGAQVQAAVETDTVLALLQPLLDDGPGALAAILPGALVATLRSVPGLRVRALVDPLVETPIGLLSASHVQPTPALSAALALAGEAEWLVDVAARTGGGVLAVG